jgi:hypothetical protein
MLKIRKEQMNTFKDHILHNFEDKMFMHLKSQFPDQTQQIEESQLREMIHDGIFRAQKYGVTLEPDICRYLECMVLHGVDFDTNPKTSWAGDILRDKGMSGREKMNRIDDYEMFTLGEM